MHKSCSIRNTLISNNNISDDIRITGLDTGPV